MAKSKKPSRLAAISAQMCNRTGDKLPPGWESATEIAEQEGLAEGTVRKRLTAAAKQGLVESRTFKRFVGGQIRHIRYWKLPPA